MIAGAGGLASGQSADHGVPPGPKRPRLAAERPELIQPLHIDIRDAEVKREPTYNPQVEAISPTLPPEDNPSKTFKDEQVQAITRVEHEISQVEQQIKNLKKKQVLNYCYYLDKSIGIHIVLNRKNRDTAFYKI